MKKIFILALCCLAITGKVFAQFSATLAGYPLVTTGWNIGGNATVVDSTVRLTAPSGDQSGYVYYNTPVNLTSCGIFTVDFDFKIVASPSSDVADGIAFWYISNPPVGFATGGGIGLPSNPDGLIMILDTYDNIGTPDLNPKETLLGYNGGIAGYVEGSTAGLLCPVSTLDYFIDDGTWHHCKITYNSGTINAYFNYSTTPSQTGYYPMSINGYFGFSSSTGAAYSTQSVKDIYITAALPSPPTVPDSVITYCQGATADSLVAIPGISQTLEWFTTDTATVVSLPGSPIPNTSVPGITWYYVRETEGTCISAADSIEVIVNPIPPVPTLGSNMPVCSGGALDLTATDTTGATYSWVGPNAFTSTLENPVINPAMMTDSGTYEVYVNRSGCIDSGSIYIVIDSTPAVPVAGSNVPICSDSTLYLTASDATAGVTYNWSGPSGFISPLQNPDITGVTTATSGVYTVVVTLAACSDSSSILVHINPAPPLPILSSNAPTCSGKSLNLFATDDSSATTYSWMGPNGFSSNLQNPIINPVDTEATGIYTVIATLNGCPSIPVTLAALVDSTPAGMVVSSNSPICQYNTLLFTAYTPTPGVLYTWSGPLSFSTTIENPVIGDANTDAGGQYRVIASRGFCYDTSFLDVIIDSIPLNLNIGGSTPVCSQSTLTLYSTFTPSGGTYSWTGPDGYSTVSISSNQNIYNATTLASGIYTVTETLSGCTSAIAVTPYLTVDSTPQVPNISSNSPVCEGSTLNLYSSDSTQAVSYSWMGPNGFSSSIQNPSIYTVTPAAAGDYTVTATLGICSTPAQTTVAITLTPSFTPTSNSPVCSGDTLFLYANNVAGSTVSWSGPYTFTSLAPDPLRPSAVTEDGGIYEVQALLNGCYSTAYDTVVINQTPGPPFVSWLTYCQYYPAPPLMANDTNVLWYNTDMATGGSPIPPVPSTANIGTTFYYATQTVSGCISAIDSIQVTVNPTPTVTVTPADTAVCPHSSYQLTATSTAALATYQWYPSIYLDNTNTATVTTSPETNITYTVVSGNQYGCTDTVTSSVTVYPAAVIYLGDSVTLYPGETYTMSPQTNCTQFSWFPPAGLSNNTIPNPVASPAVSTKYTLYGQTENGCIASDSIEIYESSQSQVALPNAFTPGSGANNEFKIIRKGIVSLNYFRIFDRWGQKVFETTNIDMGWDGSFNGTPQPFGVYVYEIEAVSSTDQNILLHGNVTLLR